MSKSKKNIVDPEDLIAAYGADTARLFTLFAAPPEKDLEWSAQGVEGAYRFLSRLWRLVHQHRDLWSAVNSAPAGDEPGAELRELRRAVHRTIKKVSDDIDGRFHFNTAIAAIMELLNLVSVVAQDREKKAAGASFIREGLDSIIVLLAPFVPHIASELWHQSGHREPLDRVAWPCYSEAALEEEQLLIVVQVNGKVRGKMTVPADITPERLEASAMADVKVMNFCDGKKIKRVVYVPRRLINIVVEG
jgi:leucyl-tRNA synthetase